MLNLLTADPLTTVYIRRTYHKERKTGHHTIKTLHVLKDIYILLRKSYIQAIAIISMDSFELIIDYSTMQWVVFIRAIIYIYIYRRCVSISRVIDRHHGDCKTQPISSTKIGSTNYKSPD